MKVPLSFSHLNFDLPFAICHLPIRFSELANTPHSPLANAQANAKAKLPALPFAIRFSGFTSLPLAGECKGKCECKPNLLYLKSHSGHTGTKTRLLCVK